MPIFSCGMMRSMFSWKDIDNTKISEISQQKLAIIVHTALKHGIKHIETARGYGSSERQLAPILADYERNTFILQTKVKPEDDSSKFIANVEDSLKRLGQKRVDLLTLHGINDHRSLWQACRPNGCLDAAKKLQAKGMADWIGFSGHGDIEVIMNAIEHQGDNGFDFINLHWYPIFQRNSPALAAAKAREMGVFIISPTDKGGMLQNPSPKLQKACLPLTPIQFNDLFCLQREEIHTISIGVISPLDFNDHLTVLDKLEDAELVRKIYQNWTAMMKESCSMERPDGLWQLLPDWQQTPGYINIGYIFWLDSLAKGWGLFEFARKRYKKLGNNMPWVQGNNAANADQYQLDDIAEKVGLTGEELSERLIQAHTFLGSQENCDKCP